MLEAGGRLRARQPRTADAPDARDDVFEPDRDCVLRHAGKCVDADSERREECRAALCGLLGPIGERLSTQGTLDLRRITAVSDTYLGDLDLDDDESAREDDLDEFETTAVEPLLDGDLLPDGPAFVLLARGVVTAEELRPSGSAAPTLEAHATAVRDRAACFVARSGLPAPVAAAVVLAARAHDHGKGDARVQRFFRGGTPALLADQIAKSVFGTADRQAERAARRAGGLPDGLRHEIASVAALGDALANGTVGEMPPEVDIELALHLVATHHGLGRPVPRVPSQRAAGSAPVAAPREFAVSAAGIVGRARGDGVEGWEEGAWLRRFLAIVDRYGPWGSAYLEALLVLADRSISAEGG